MGAKVLIVDDDPAVRRSLSRALTLEGYDVWFDLSKLPAKRKS